MTTDAFAHHSLCSPAPVPLSCKVGMETTCLWHSRCSAMHRVLAFQPHYLCAVRIILSVYEIIKILNSFTLSIFPTSKQLPLLCISNFLQFASQVAQERICYTYVVIHVYLTISIVIHLFKPCGGLMTCPLCICLPRCLLLSEDECLVKLGLGMAQFNMQVDS